MDWRCMGVQQSCANSLKAAVLLSIHDGTRLLRVLPCELGEFTRQVLRTWTDVRRLDSRRPVVSATVVCHLVSQTAKSHRQMLNTVLPGCLTF